LRPFNSKNSLDNVIQKINTKKAFNKSDQSSSNGEETNADIAKRE
jgi:hypothetical protein